MPMIAQKTEIDNCMKKNINTKLPKTRKVQRKIKKSYPVYKNYISEEKAVKKIEVLEAKLVYKNRRVWQPTKS